MAANNFKKPKKEKTGSSNSPVSRFIQSMLDGSLLTRQKVSTSLPFIFFIAGLAIFFISNTYYAEKQGRKLEALRKEIVELRTRHTLTKSELMFLSNQSELLRRLRARGFVESKTPPVQIKEESTGQKLMRTIF